MQAGALLGATIVFDLDGTLVDTAPDLMRALHRTLDLEGLPHPPLDKVRTLIGKGARAMIERAAELAGAHFSPPRLDELFVAFVDYYRADIAGSSAPFPGCLQALDALAQQGAHLAVCTNKRTDLSIALLRALDMERRFSAIIGADATPEKKPHPDHFRHAVRSAGGDPRQALMVGDTIADVAAAKGAGAPAVIVRFGYDAAPEALGADAVIAHYDELPRLALRLLR